MKFVARYFENLNLIFFYLSISSEAGRGLYDICWCQSFFFLSRCLTPVYMYQIMIIISFIFRFSFTHTCMNMNM